MVILNLILITSSLAIEGQGHFIRGLNNFNFEMTLSRLSSRSPLDNREKILSH